ncbi:AAA family ATPase [Nonomuraea glycinis]|uniref:AAA family ATPase n=1 Tax=Nonomuraea glycinis TaxID=2047744 RepID=UPI002E0E7528|nr:AAA family ATPase [Nonomuraea glycinis]
MADYPGRNPFPARGTSSAEETSLPDFLHDWAQHTPTAPLSTVRETERLAEDYMRGFEHEPGRDGSLGCLYGSHGVGKTHAARHMMAFLHGENPQTVQLYLKFQENDFVAAYRRLVSQLPQHLLEDLSQRYRDTLTKDLTARITSASTGDADERPPSARMIDLIEPVRVDAGEVLEEQAKEIAAVAGNGPVFQRALSFLLRPEFSDAAYDWLCGRPISADSSRALGVSNQIDDPLTCRYGLQLLTTLVTRAGRPFVLVLDQCEKFLLEDGRPVRANFGLVQGLVEQIPKASGMLLLLSSEAAWNHMPPDLRQRIGTGAVHMLPLTPDEARMVLSTYINTTRPGPDAGIRPFTEAGLLELLRQCGGNIRLLLQLAWVSFDASVPGSVIDADSVTSASARRGRYLTLSDLGTLVEKKLLSAGLTTERVEAEGQTVVFQVSDRQEPRAVVMLNGALFHESEIAPLLDEVRPDRHRVFTALVVTGYISPPLLDVLGNAAHRVLIADRSPAFSRQLDELVEQVATALSEHAPAGLDETLRRLNSRLDGLSSSQPRGATLDRDVGEAAEQHERDRPPSGWQVRRNALTGRIAEARAARAHADWEEFRKARAQVVAEYRMHRRRLAAAVCATLLIIGVSIATQALTTVSPASMLLTAAAVAGLATAVGTAVKLTGAARSRPNVQLASRRDLDQLARELRHSGGVDSPDPVIRYASALRENPDESHQLLVDALLVEPMSFIRQAIGHRLAMAKAAPADCVTEVLHGLRERVPEILLLLAREQRHTGPARPPRVLRDLPPDLRVLVALANPSAVELADGAVTRSPAESVLATLGVRGVKHPFARAFQKGSAELAPVEFPPNDLRAAARLLSPLEPGGFGTYDWLPVIAEIDDLYLFFEEVLYHQEKNHHHRRDP